MKTSPEPQEFTKPAPRMLHHPSDIRLYELLTRHRWDPDTLDRLYRRHGVAEWEGPAELVREITRDGSNTIISLLMGDSEKSYRDIARAVAEKLKVPLDDADNEMEIEWKCLEAVLRQYLNTAPEEERRRILGVIEDTGRKIHSDEVLRKVRDNTLRIGTLSLLVREIGARATASVVRRVVARIVGRQAAKEVSKRAAQLAGFAIPLLNAVMIGWTVWDLAGPAYRKTIPTVLELAMLRLEAGNGDARRPPGATSGQRSP
ncbi:MAG TPA: hypothetical protein PLV45_10880 [bacterium]|nr:hypothetical protein [bacterium]